MEKSGTITIRIDTTELQLDGGGYKDSVDTTTFLAKVIKNMSIFESMLPDGTRYVFSGNKRIVVVVELPPQKRKIYRKYRKYMGGLKFKFPRLIFIVSLDEVGCGRYSIRGKLRVFTAASRLTSMESVMHTLTMRNCLEDDGGVCMDLTMMNDGHYTLCGMVGGAIGNFFTSPFEGVTKGEYGGFFVTLIWWILSKILPCNIVSKIITLRRKKQYSLKQALTDYCGINTEKLLGGSETFEKMVDFFYQSRGGPNDVSSLL